MWGSLSKAVRAVIVARTPLGGLIYIKGVRHRASALRLAIFCMSQLDAFT
jgi:hypothetical protein